MNYREDDEDFELILGNKQLFFLTIVLFGVFFSIGYSVGYNSGQGEEPATLAANEPLREPPQGVGQPVVPAPEQARLTPPKNDPSPGQQELPIETKAQTKKDLAADKEPPVKKEPKPSAEASSRAASPRAELRDIARVQERKPAPRPQVPAVKPAPAKERRSAPAPAAAAPAPKKEPSKPRTTAASRPSNTPPATSSASGDGKYLQVLARRDRAAAEEFKRQLNAKGYPSVVEPESADGWNRVVVGPLPDNETAAEYQARLKQDGFHSFLRMP